MSGLYIHIPFCKQSCIYCNFYFKNGRKHAPLFVESLLKEIDIKLNKKSEHIQTLYFGGGTPSYLELADLQKILNALKSHFNFNQLLELTFEANPDDMTQENLIAWKSMGVTRLSVGVQSFFDEHLKWMNRAHSASEAHLALKNAHDLGFDLSIDIIFGIPGCSHDQHIENLTKALSYNIQHLSCYGLTLEDKTPWKKLIQTKSYASPDDGLSAEQFQLTMDFMRKNNWIQYEMSNYCLPGKEALQNTAYWKNTSYIGLGPAAHSYDGIKRCWNVADIRAYSESLAIGVLPEECEVLSVADRFNEYVMTSLRTSWGVSTKEIQSYSDFASNTFNQLEVFCEKALIEKKGESYILTDKGKYYADAISADLFITQSDQ
ncbi:MAG: radical SAM family heme chaperone HemW [Bacteroidia bacterium]|nr:radical SAM family heme chaperone HemW [Bacteroidia bacterium]